MHLLPHYKFKIIVGLLEQGHSRRTIAREAKSCKRTVDKIAWGKHRRQQLAQPGDIVCKGCGYAIEQAPCRICAARLLRDKMNALRRS